MEAILDIVLRYVWMVPLALAGSALSLTLSLIALLKGVR